MIGERQNPNFEKRVLIPKGMISLWTESIRDMQTKITDGLLNKITTFFESILKNHGKIDILEQVDLFNNS